MVPRHKVFITSIIITLLGLVIVSSLYFYLFISNYDFASIISSELTKWTGFNVTVGQVRPGFLGRLIVKDVLVMDGSSEPILKVPKMKVGYSLVRLLISRHDPIKGLTHISLENPVFYLSEDESGNWNLKDIPTQKVPIDDSGSFSNEQYKEEVPIIVASVQQINGERLKVSSSLQFPRIDIKGGTIIINPQKLQEYRFKDIDGSIQGKDSFLFIKMYSPMGNSKDSKIAVEGSINLQERILSLKADFSELDMGYMAEVTPIKIPFVDIHHGKADGYVRLRGTNMEDMMLSGTLKVNDGELEVYTIDGVFKRVKGSFSITRSSLIIDELSGELDGIVTKISGKVLDFAAPALELDLTSEFNALKYYLYTAPYIEAFGLYGDGSVQVRIEGPAIAPTVFGSAQLKEGFLYSQQVKDVTADFGYSHGHLSINEIEGNMGQGTFSGDLLLNGDAYTVTTSVTDIALKELDIHISDSIEEFIDINGRLNGEAIISGQVEKGFDVAGSTNIDNLFFAGLDFNDVKGLFWFDGKEKIITLDRVVGEGKDLYFSANGDIHLNGETDLKIDAKGVDIEKVLNTFDIKGIAFCGKGDFNGSLRGSLGSPQLAGVLRINNGHLLGQDFDEAKGSFEWTGENLKLSDTTIKKGYMEYKVCGEIMPEDAEMDLDIDVTKVDIKQLLGMAKIDTSLLSGVVSGTFKLCGPFSLPRTHGTIEIAEGCLWNFRIDNGTLTFNLEGTDFRIEDFAGIVNGSPVHLKGSLYDAQVMDLTVDADQVELATFDIIELPKEFQPLGKLNFTGKVTGPFEEFNVDGRIYGTGVGIDKLIFDKVHGDLKFSNGTELPFFHISLEKGRGLYLLDGNLFSSFNVKIKEGDIRDCLSLLGLIPDSQVPFDEFLSSDLKGTVNGSITLEGEGPSASSQIMLTLEGVNGGTGQIDNITIDAIAKEGLLRVNELQAFQGKGHLFMHGTAYLDGDLAMDIAANDFTLSPLLGIFRINYVLNGVADFSAKLRGSISKPELIFDLNVKDSAIGDFVLGNIQGSCHINEGIISMEDMTIHNNGHRILLDGKFPLSTEDILDIEGTDAYLELKGADFGFLPLFFPEIGTTSGKIDAHLRISYTQKAPKLYGYLSLKDGEIKNEYFIEPINALEANIEFRGDSAVINSFNGNMGNNAKLTGGGSVSMEGLLISKIDLELMALGAGLTVAGYKGYADADIKISGSDPKTANLKGQLKLYNGEISLQQPPALLGSLPWNPQIDADIIVSKGVSLRSKGIDVPFMGQLHVGGNLSSPHLDGEMESSRGYFVLFGTQFYLRSASAKFSPLKGFSPFLKMNGEGIVQGFTIYVDMSGTPDDLQTTWNSEPFLREDEIISLLTFPKVISGLIEGDVGEEYISSSILRYIENEISTQVFSGVSNILRGALSLDEFIIERNVKSRFEIKLGKYLVDILYLGYIKELSIDDDRGSWILEYRAKPNISLKGSLEGNGEYRLSLETKYEF